MQYQVINTCGTSTLTSPARGNKILTDSLTKWSNAKIESDIVDVDLENIKNHWSEQIYKWENYNVEEAKINSAELKSLISWQEKNKINSRDCFCYLIYTDTVFGWLAAQLVEVWLKKNNYQGVKLVAIGNLQTSDLETFEEGLSNLARWAFDNIDPDNKSVKRVFNVAGGFKSVSGFMQLLGQFLADETIYIFESGNNVLSIPRMPVIWSEVDSIREYFDDYHRIALGISLENYSHLNSLWIKRGKFTPWGLIAWENAKKKLYTEKVFPIIYDKVVEGKRFRNSLFDLDGTRIKQLNERLDDLCFYKKGEGRNCIKRLDYKKLRQVHEDCTHECDAWADKDCRRLFCNEKEGKIIVELLGKPLH